MDTVSTRSDKEYVDRHSKDRRIHTLRLSAMTLTSERASDYSDGTTETWWATRRSEHRGMEIATTVKTIQRADSELTNQDVALLISDHTTPRTINIPVSILDHVIATLQAARADVSLVWEHVTK